MKRKLFLATFVICILLAGGATSYAATATHAAAASHQMTNQSSTKAKGVSHHRKRSKRAAMNVRKGGKTTARHVKKPAKK